MDWTEEKIVELWHLWGNGHSGTQIAEIMQTTKNAIISRVHRSGFPGRSSPLGLRGAANPNHRFHKPPVPKPATTATLAVAKSSVITRRATRFISPFDNLTPRPVVRVEAPVRIVAPSRRCTWTDSNGPPWLWCDAPCEGSWCEKHKKRVWVQRRAA